jgi:hypothetical protein
MDAREIEGGHTTAHLAGLRAIIALSPRPGAKEGGGERGRPVTGGIIASCLLPAAGAMPITFVAIR